MFTSTLIAVFMVAFVKGQSGSLEQECNILQTLEDLQNRLTAAETDVGTLKSGRTIDATEISNLKSSLTNAEIQVTNLKTSLTRTETQVTNLRNTLTNTESQITQQATDITTLRDSVTAADTKIDQQATEITTLHDAADQQATEIAELQDSLATAEAEIANLQTPQSETSQPTNVLFHVQDVFPQPTINNAILFQTVVENVGDAYSTSAGCFTAPIGGAYWFSSHICASANRWISPSLIIRGTVASRVRVYDAGNESCGSVTAVATLEVGDIVCLKSGPHQATNPVWSYAPQNYNNFMGAIIN